jgi:hypothetical protein
MDGTYKSFPDKQAPGVLYQGQNRRVALHCPKCHSKLTFWEENDDTVYLVCSENTCDTKIKAKRKTDLEELARLKFKDQEKIFNQG